MSQDASAYSELLARLTCRGAEIESAELILRRPLQVLQGLLQQPAETCLHRLPLLFPLCGHAHALAACEAIEAAVGVQASPADRAARATVALADAVAAHVWRTTLDWPELLDEAADAARVAQARRLVAAIAASLYPHGDWHAVGGGRLAPDLAQLKAARVQLGLLRDAMDFERVLAAMRVRLSSALIGADPLWASRLQPCFTEMAAAAANSFAVLDARLQAVASLPPGVGAADFAARVATASGRGQGQAHTARGPLNYEVALAQGCLVGCRVEAPIDRAFAPDGTAAGLLNRLQRAENPAAAARWILAAFDPCTSVRVELVRREGG